MLDDICFVSFLKVLIPNRNPVDDLYRLFPQLPSGEKPLNGKI